MRIDEVKQLVPLADTYQLDPNGIYLIHLPEGTLQMQAFELLRGLTQTKCMAKAIVYIGDTPQFFQIG